MSTLNALATLSPQADWNYTGCEEEGYRSCEA